MLTARSSHFTVLFPSQWDEVTLEQFLDIRNATGHSEVLQALASDRSLLANFDALEELNTFNALTFLRKAPKTNARLPKKVLGVSLNVSGFRCNLGQKWAYQEWIKEVTNEGELSEPLTYALPVLCCYLHPVLRPGEKFSLEAAKELTDVVKVMPCIEALTLANYVVGELSKPQPSAAVYTVTKRGAEFSRWQKAVEFIRVTMLRTERVTRRIRPIKLKHQQII